MADLSFLKSLDLFEGLSDKELALLLPLTRVHAFEEGQYIFKEGEEGNSLYVVQEGEVEILKKGVSLVDQFPLAQIHARDWFGEMAFFGVSVRSASARALGPARVLEFSLEELNELAKKECVYSRISVNLAKKMSRRIKEMNETFIHSLEKKMEILRTHDHMSHLIINLFFLFVFFFYTFKLFDEYAPPSWMAALVPGILILCFTVSVIWLVHRSGNPMSFYGLTWKNWKRNAIEGAVLTVPILIGMIPFKWLMIQTFGIFQDLQVFSFGSSGGEILHSQHSFLPVIIYSLLVPLQEFIARGCLQTTLQNFFIAKNRVFLAILTSNLLFFLFHGFKSFSFAAFAFVFGLFWGWMYSRQHSIVGSTVSHLLVGIWGFGFLNFQSILIR